MTVAYVAMHFCVILEFIVHGYCVYNQYGMLPVIGKLTFFLANKRLETLMIPSVGNLTLLQKLSGLDTQTSLRLFQRQHHS